MRKDGKIVSDLCKESELYDSYRTILSLMGAARRDGIVPRGSPSNPQRAKLSTPLSNGPRPLWTTGLAHPPTKSA